MNVTGQQVLDFIFAQPDDRKIVGHNSWAECAFGDFCREVLNVELPDTWGARFDDRCPWKELFAPESPLTSFVINEGTSGAASSIDVIVGYDTGITREQIARDHKTLYDVLNRGHKWANTYGELKKEIIEQLKPEQLPA